MKSILLVVLIAAAATAAVVSNDVPDAMELTLADEVADLDMNEMPEVVTDVFELADADDLTDVAEETAVDSRRQLSQGSIGHADVMIHNSEQRSLGVNGQITIRHITASTHLTITAIRVWRVGLSQNATPSIRQGGIGDSFVTIRLQSASGRGFHYRVQVYAR